MRAGAAISTRPSFHFDKWGGGGDAEHAEVDESEITVTVFRVHEVGGNEAHLDIVVTVALKNALRETLTS